MRRRDFVTLIGATAATWPLAAHGQQPTMPVIGFVHLMSSEETREYLAAFRKGLGYTGFVEGSNVRIEYRWGDGKNDRLAALLAELVQRQVSVLRLSKTAHFSVALPILARSGHLVTAVRW